MRRNVPYPRFVFLKTNNGLLIGGTYRPNAYPFGCPNRYTLEEHAKGWEEFLDKVYENLRDINTSTVPGGTPAKIVTMLQNFLRWGGHQGNLRMARRNKQ